MLRSIIFMLGILLDTEAGMRVVFYLKFAS